MSTRIRSRSRGRGDGQESSNPVGCAIVSALTSYLTLAEINFAEEKKVFGPRYIICIKDFLIENV